MGVDQILAVQPDTLGGTAGCREPSPIGYGTETSPQL